MYRLTRAALPLALLAACMAGPSTIPGYRNPAVAISSSANFEGGRFAGPWQVVAAFGEGARCGILAEDWQVEAGAYVVRGADCRGGRRVGLATRAYLVGPGRILRKGPGGDEALWVLWMDADYRVAAIGTPDGRFGRIIARPGAVRADLLTAARDILAFNGYDISRLQFLR